MAGILVSLVPDPVEAVFGRFLRCQSGIQPFLAFPAPPRHRHRPPWCRPPTRGMSVHMKVMLSLDAVEQAKLQTLTEAIAQTYPGIPVTADGVLRGLLRGASLESPQPPAPDRRRVDSAQFASLTRDLPPETAWALWAQCARHPPSTWGPLIREIRLEAVLAGYSGVQAETLRLVLEQVSQELWPDMVARFRAVLGLPAIPG